MRWQFSLATLFLATSIVCFGLAIVRDYRVLIVGAAALTVAAALFILGITCTLGPGEDVPDLDDEQA